jgi:hypothetical protein
MSENATTVAIAPVHAVTLQVYGELVVRQGPEPSLRISGDPELVAKASAETRGDTLELTLGRDWVERVASGFAMLGNRPLRYELTVPALERLEVAGRGRLDLDGLEVGTLTVKVSGLADGALRGLAVEALDVEIAGRAELDLAGRAERLKVRISGSAELGAFELTSQEADVRISGHGEAEVAVVRSLHARIAGYGHVTYVGDPTVDQAVSGGGSVRRREAGG